MVDLVSSELRRLTPARVGLARAGNSVATRELLDFQLAHARARDAVHRAFDASAAAREVESCGLRPLVVASAARDRQEYLRRPDLGRRLDEVSRGVLGQLGGQCDVVFIVADGLSALAVQTQAAGLIGAVVERLDAANWRVGPVVIVTQGRVALSDEIGAALGASLVVMLIGERPGLSAADSMGVYLTWAPAVGRTDADRNCISNIRPGGLSIAAARELLLLLMREARSRQISGVGLKVDGVGLISGQVRT